MDNMIEEIEKIAKDEESKSPEKKEQAEEQSDSVRKVNPNAEKQEVTQPETEVKPTIESTPAPSQLAESQAQPQVTQDMFYGEQKSENDDDNEEIEQEMNEAEEVTKKKRKRNRKKKNKNKE